MDTVVKLICITAVTMLAGLIQGICGFGSGPVNMMMLPLMMPLSQAAGITSVFSIPSTLALLLRYRKSFRLKNAYVQALIYLSVSSITVLLFKSFNAEILKRAFGVFLVFLAVYNFALSGKPAKRWSKGAMIAAFSFAGICSGLFSVGGPLISVYFLANSDSKEEFLASTEFVFFCNVVVTTITRISSGVLGVGEIRYVIPGIIGMLWGVGLANCVVDRIDSKKLKTIVYAFIGISGVCYMLGM